MPGSPHRSAANHVPWTKWLQDRGFADLLGIEAGSAHLFDQMIWQPAKADRRAAWKLYTELRTRITTQTLAFRHGDEATALDSVYRLFEISRSIIKEHHGCTHFATLTVQVLNTRVRPFTAAWHRVKLEGRLASADVRFTFRSELRALQPWLQKFTELLGLLAGDPSAIAELAGHPAPDNRNPANLWASLPLRIPAETWNAGTNLDDINTKESAEVKKRREKYFGEGAGIDNGIGLAISGGGIRSATFALGVVQVLARKGILRQVDYLSTVSGGGYLGAFISSFLNDADEQVSLEAGQGKLPFGAEGNGESQSVRHLRNHSKYLSEGGLKTFATMVALVAYGVLVSILLLSPFLFTAVLIAAWLFPGVFQPGWAPPARLSDVTIVSLIVSGLGVALLPIAQKFGDGGQLQKSWETGCIVAAGASVLLLLCEGFPYAFQAVEHTGGAWVAFTFALLFPLVCGGLGFWLGADSLAGRILLGLLRIAGPLFIVTALFWLFEFFIAGSPHPDLLFLAIITGALWFYTSFVLNINFASPHRFYRNRLARTYLTRRHGAGVQPCDPQLLSAMNAQNKAPYHLINAALNIPSCKDPNLRGRNTDFFMFSKHYCGSPIMGFDETRKWEEMDPHLDVGAAMAISGAAAAPHMGTLTTSRYTFLLAMLNMRLGYWLRRPASGWTKYVKKLFPPVGWLYFFRELTGLMSERTAFVNTSDGGHIENLGIYELLRRRCKFVIAIDGEADPHRSFGGLLSLTQLAKIDLGVTIDPDLSDLRVDAAGHGRAHFGLSRIDYPDGDHGLLLYIKSSLTGNESEFLKKYRAENPDFPHQSTAQQLYSETQFEAYRALGEHVAGDLFRPDIAGDWQHSPSVQQWFQSLATHLW